MLLIILALLWAMLLIPMAVRRLREGSTEKSIEHFHTEREVLTRKEYAVAPAYRLDERESYEPQVDAHRPHLQVVHDHDTYRTLESRSSWEEWSQDYDFDADDRAARVAPANRYAAAYAATPTAREQYVDEEPLRWRSMRRRRRVFFTRLVLVAVVATLAAFLTGYSVVLDFTALAWVAVVAYVALAFYAVSQGLLDETSIGLRARRSLATVEPLYRARDDDADDTFDGFGGTGYAESEDRDARYDYEYGAAPDSGPWRRESRARYAVG